MKIRLGDLRKMIRESFKTRGNATADVRPEHEALGERLFPLAGGSTVAKKISKAYLYWRNEEPSEFKNIPSGQGAVAHWVSQNYDELLRVTDGGNVKFLGRGEGGDAFAFTGKGKEGMVLKFEPDFFAVGADRTDRYGGNVSPSDAATYEKGEFPLLGMKGSGRSVWWSIKEKVETIPEKFIAPLEKGMSHLYKFVAPRSKVKVDLAAAYQLMDPSLSGSMSAALGLDDSPVPARGGERGSTVPRWFDDLYTAMSTSSSNDMRSVNIGIRRFGGKKVQWVFFD